MRIRMIVVLTLFLALPLAARAQEKGGAQPRSISELEAVATSVPAKKKGMIHVRSIAELEAVSMDAQGKKAIRRMDAARTKVLPGDTVVFTTFYRNIGDQPAEKVVITNPLPGHTSYRDKSAEGKGTRIEFSVDGGRTYDVPERLTVSNGEGRSRKATADDYTHIRWTLAKPLPPGRRGRVTFKVKIK